MTGYFGAAFRSVLLHFTIGAILRFLGLPSRAPGRFGQPCRRPDCAARVPGASPLRVFSESSPTSPGLLPDEELRRIRALASGSRLAGPTGARLAPKAAAPAAWEGRDCETTLGGLPDAGSRARPARLIRQPSDSDTGAQGRLGGGSLAGLTSDTELRDPHSVLKGALSSAATTPCRNAEPSARPPALAADGALPEPRHERDGDRGLVRSYSRYK